MFELERLGEDRVGVAQPRVRDFHRSGDEDDRDPRPPRQALRHERVAPFAAEMDVEHDDVDVFLRQRRARCGERVSLEHLVPVELEVDAAEQPDRRLVVDDKDPGRRMTLATPHLAASLTAAAVLVRTRARPAVVYPFEVAKDCPQPDRGGRRGVRSADPARLPHPTQRFRREAWLAFQRALDPLAPPKPLPPRAITLRQRPPPAGG